MRGRRGPLKKVPDTSVCSVQVRMRGKLKNRIVAGADSLGLTLNQFGAMCMKEYLDRLDKLPLAPRGRVPIPTPTEVLRDYLNPSGEPLLGPCGRAWPCEADGNTEDIGGVGYCGHCGIRVS